MKKPARGVGGLDRTIDLLSQNVEAAMTRAYFQQIAAEVIVVSTSGLFLGWYIWAKIAVWPWGASSF